MMGTQSFGKQTFMSGAKSVRSGALSVASAIRLSLDPIPLNASSTASRRGRRGQQSDEFGQITEPNLHDAGPLGSPYAISADTDRVGGVTSDEED